MMNGIIMYVLPGNSITGVENCPLATLVTNPDGSYSVTVEETTQGAGGSDTNG